MHKRNYIEIAVILIGMYIYCVETLITPLFIGQDFWVKFMLVLLIGVMVFDILTMIYWR